MVRVHLQDARADVFGGRKLHSGISSGCGCVGVSLKGVEGVCGFGERR